MDRTQKRCLIGSVLLHGTLLAVLVAGAAFAPKPEIPSVPFLELLPTDLKLTDGNQIGGGTPNAKSPAGPRPNPLPEPSQQPPAAAKPPTTRKPDPEKRDETKPVKEKAQKAQKTAPVKADKSSKDKPDTSKNTPPEKTQAVDSTKRLKRVVQIAERTLKRPSNTDEETQKERAATEKREANAQREREEAEQRTQAIEAANTARRDLANRLLSGATTISQGMGSSTTIEMPGPGGQAYAPYISYLGLFYRERWKNPRSTSRSKAYVGASVEIAKDGTVVDWKLTDPCGIREVDDSVREVLKRYQRLRPLPGTTTDPKRLFTIQFRLDADSNL
jgi:membrane protein involved in colicin uptake